MSTEEPPVVTPPRPPSRLAGALITAGGLLVAAVAALVTALGELYLTPLRAGGYRLGLAIPVAAGLNWAIAWFAAYTTGRLRAVALPWALWTLFMLVATGYRRPEGDLLVAGGDWVAIGVLLAGSTAFAVFLYRRILHRGRDAERD